MDLQDRRRFYAEEIQVLANIRTPALVEALAHVPREKARTRRLVPVTRGVILFKCVGGFKKVKS